MKSFILMLVLFFATAAYSQKFSKTLFKNTSWFASNDVNGFFTNDTVKLIKHNSCIKAFDVKYYCEDEEKTTKHKEVVEIKFKSRKINLITKNGNGWNMSTLPQSWRLKKSSILEIKFHKKTYLFVLLEINSISAKTEYEQNTPTLELVMVRIKNYPLSTNQLSIN
ncbi:MAG: hypothetical protein KA319_00660 [Ferruginibacter sp.]|nr:hypothetical protein [Ferruginibacter sp.]